MKKDLLLGFVLGSAAEKTSGGNVQVSIVSGEMASVEVGTHISHTFFVSFLLKLPSQWKEIEGVYCAIALLYLSWNNIPSRAPGL